MFEEFENYYGKFEKASVGRRIAAFIADYIVFHLAIVALGLIFNPENSSMFSVHLEGFSAFIGFVIALSLWPISEGVFGQTIGKRVLDIKVISKNNEDITLGQAFGRFFIGIIDFMICIGIIVAIIDKNNCRIGDFAAGTLVVKVNKDLI